MNINEGEKLEVNASQQCKVVERMRVSGSFVFNRKKNISNNFLTLSEIYCLPWQTN